MTIPVEAFAPSAGVAVALIGLLGALLVKERRRNGLGGNHDSYLEADRTAAMMLKRDLGDVNLEICGFHKRMGESLEAHTDLLKGIKGRLDNIDTYGVKQR